MRYLALLTLAGTLAAGDTRYARLGEWGGFVEVQLRAAQPWMPAERNLPLVESTWLRTGAASKLEVEFDEGSVWRLGPDARGGISDYTRLSTGQRVTLLSLEHGLAWFTGQADGNDSLVLSVPGAQVSITRNARIRLDVRDQTASIAVLSGVVRFSSPAAALDLREGQTTRVEAANPGRFFLFKEIAAEELDGWSDDRDKALAGSTSAGHLWQRSGLVDLDAAGEWVETEELGSVWKPKVAKDWTPFRVGRWRSYDSLGYTWVSGEPWGWLPYHFGRWALTKDLTWVWAPGSSTIFKPGEVFWRRGDALTGWGPLAPGELFPSPDPDHPQPQQFLASTTVWAAFQADTDLIDPAGFAKAPKDPLKQTTLVPALPSPGFVAARLEAVRPTVEPGRNRVVPIVESTTFETTAAVRVAPAPPPPQPVIIITEPAAPVRETVEVPVPYAVPIGIPVAVPSAPAKPSKPSVAPSSGTAGPKPAPPAASPTRPVNTAGPRPVPRRNLDEPDLRNSILADLNQQEYENALTGLEIWSTRFPRTPLADVRQLHYMQAYNGLNRAEQVIDAGAPLLDHNLPRTLPDTAHIVAVFSLLCSNVQKLTSPRPEQLAAGARAATALLTVLPTYFTAKSRPEGVTAAQWTNTRDGLEALARQTLGMVQKRAAASH